MEAFLQSDLLDTTICLTFFANPLCIIGQKFFFPIEKVQKLFGSQKYSKCQTTPDIEKNKLLLNE